MKYMDAHAANRELVYKLPLVSALALSIAARAEAQGWKKGTIKANEKNLECWAGAIAGLELSGSDHGRKKAQNLSVYVAMVISVRGYAETLVQADAAIAKLTAMAAGEPVESE